MNKKLMVWIFCGLTICLCCGTLTAGKLVFFLNGGAGGGSQMDGFNYSDSYQDTFYGYSFVESGEIANNSNKGKTFSGGVTYYFTPNLGISLSVSHSKRNISMETDFQTLMTLESGNRIVDETDSWGDTGQLYVTPVNINVTYRLLKYKELSINVMTGVSLMLNKINIPARIGFSSVGISEEPGVTGFTTFADYFRGNTAIRRETNSRIGFNAGMELEQKLSPRWGISGGVQYFKTAKQEFTWEMESQERYIGVMGEMNLIGATNLYIIDPVVREIDLSFFQVYLGFKYYL